MSSLGSLFESKSKPTKGQRRSQSPTKPFLPPSPPVPFLPLNPLPSFVPQQALWIRALGARCTAEAGTTAAMAVAPRTPTPSSAVGDSCPRSPPRSRRAAAASPRSVLTRPNLPLVFRSAGFGPRPLTPSRALSVGCGGSRAGTRRRCCRSP